MITRIARKEFTEMLRDGRFRWAAAIIFALLLASVVMGGKHYREVKRQHDLVQAETRDQWLRQPARNPHSAAHYGIYTFKPKLLPALLDRGVDGFAGQSVWLEAHKQNEFKLLHFDRQVLGQQTLVDRFRFLSPAIATQAALNNIAGTSAGRYRHFLSLVDEFHQNWRAHFNPRIVQKVALRADDYDRFPAFAFREEPTGAVARRVLIGLIGLLLPVLSIGWFGLRALRRYSLAG